MSTEAPTNGRSPALLSNLPVWVQGVAIVGFPILVATFYMAREAGVFPSVVTANAEVLREVVGQHQGMTVQLTELVRLTREVCHNTAKTPEATRACNFAHTP